MSTILALPASLASPAPPPAPDLLAIRARQAESVSDGTLEYAVILIEDGKITAVGEDLPIERGIPILDLPEDWVVMPGLVDAYSRYSLGGSGYNDSRGYIRASDELYSSAGLKPALEEGITTLALYPAGDAIPGKAVVVRPSGSVSDMVVQDDAYLKVVLRSNGSSKRNLITGFEKADEYLEKENKNREKWEKEQEKKKKKSKSKKDDDKDDDKDSKKEEDKKDDVYKPVDVDPKVQPFLDMRDGKLQALITITKASDYMHFLDARGDEEFRHHLRMGMSRFSDYYHVMGKVAKSGVHVVMDPELTLFPGTSRQRNLPAEFARAGVHVALIPRTDSSFGFRSWRRDVGQLVATGLDRQAALRAMTLAPAEVLGVAERLGSLEVGKDANLIILNGDPFEPATEVKQVFLDGKLVHGEMEIDQ